MNAKLIELYDCVKEKSAEKDKPLSAHTTLLIDEPQNILEILPKINDKLKKISGTIKYISLYEFFPAKMIKRIELNG
jgi:peroxiredoxin